MEPIKTFTGLTLEEAAQKLDEQLPADAYSAVPGGADLTDIDPNYMRKVLNEVFGLCGYGWGYEYCPGDMETYNETRKTQNGTRQVVVASLKHLRFWYKLEDNGQITCAVDASGGSENSNTSYAMKGAITNAIGNAVSNIGFQESVYLGKRSHKTVRAAAPAKAPAAKPNSKPAAKAAAPLAASDGEIEEVSTQRVEPAPGDMSLDEVLAYSVPTGSWKGKTFQEVVNSGENGQKAIAFWSGMSTGADADKQTLKAIAQRYAELAKSNHRVPEPA